MFFQKRNLIDFSYKFQLPLKIFRSSRKTISIQIDENLIKVRAPSWCNQRDVYKFIEKNETWIKNKVNENKNREKISKNFVDKEIFILKGKSLELRIIDDPDRNPEINEPFIFAIKDKKIGRKNYLIKEQVHNLYKNFAQKELEKKTYYYSIKIGKKPTAIQIKNYKSRWGSCSSKEQLSYNWRIIIAPDNIINYLVVHELSHLIHFNHSSKFWDQVENILPDFKDSRKWLRLNGYKLNL